ncbi:MAG: ATP-binding protein [Verrucomicrobiota bacterium]|nr:ATP-binding protein [Verrucomicrobiota bacterium]
MYKRTLGQRIFDAAGQFPVIALFGPRQSGKTTLARSLFPDFVYINLELFEEQGLAIEDPRGFLERFRNARGVILDEIQKTPQLLSYIQVEVDEKAVAGRFILTGSQNLLLNQHVSQSLAGRVALFTLLPLSIEELRQADALPSTAAEMIFQGFYPRLHLHHIDPIIFAESYVRTFVERDVRDLQQIASLYDFQKFMRLCAARIGQLLNLSDLANDAGVSLPTVKSWLSVLEASYVLFLVQPHHANFNKRLVKMPKLYFYDTSLACHLLRLTSVDDVYDHYLRGELFESMILSDFLKKRFHQALPPNVYFWRDKSGHEVDCLLEEGAKLYPIEIKSSATIQPDLFSGLQKWCELAGYPSGFGTVIYAGEEEQKRPGGQLLSWRML